MNEGENPVWYFAYGRNMNRDKMTNKGVKYAKEIPAVLINHKLVFNKIMDVAKGSGYANIMFSKGDKVEGVAYLTDEASLRALDSYEGVSAGQYRREIVSVSDFDGNSFKAIVYVALFRMTKNGLKPIKKYMNEILEGAVQHGLHEWYITDLKNIRTVD